MNWLTDQALEFIGRNRDRPWFVYLAHHTIHGPVVAPQEIVAKYRARGAPETGLHNASYLAAIETLDTSIGKLMNGIEALGQAGNTLVVFLSDNGGVFEVFDPKPAPATVDEPSQLRLDRREFSNAPLRAGKGSHYEGGIRVPCLVRWPGVAKPGTVNATPVHVIDWMPTLLDAAGATPPPVHVVDGVSLVPVLRGEAIQSRALFWYLPLYELRWGGTPSAIIREGDWKLIHFFGDWFDSQNRYQVGEHLELYNLRDDLSETVNLAGREPERVAALRTQLHQWMRSVPATVPGPNPHHDPARELAETRDKPEWLR